MQWQATLTDQLLPCRHQRKLEFVTLPQRRVVPMTRSLLTIVLLMLGDGAPASCWGHRCGFDWLLLCQYYGACPMTIGRYSHRWWGRLFKQCSGRRVCHACQWVSTIWWFVQTRKGLNYWINYYFALHIIVHARHYRKHVLGRVLRVYRVQNLKHSANNFFCRHTRRTTTLGTTLFAECKTLGI